MARMMPPAVRKVVDWVLGLGLIAAGVVLGFVPVLQGWVLVLAGLAVLSSHSRLARALHERAKKIGREVRDRFRAGRPRGPDPSR
jgi:hypothetical protein